MINALSSIFVKPQPCPENILDNLCQHDNVITSQIGEAIVADAELYYYPPDENFSSI